MSAMRESVSLMRRADVANDDGVFARVPIFGRIPAEVRPVEKDDVIRAGLDTTETFYRVAFRNVKRVLTPWGDDAPGLVGRETGMPFNNLSDPLRGMVNMADPSNNLTYNYALSGQIANFRFLRVEVRIFRPGTTPFVEISAARNGHAGGGGAGGSGQGDSGGVLEIDDAATRSAILRVTMPDGSQWSGIFNLADREDRGIPPEGNRYFFGRLSPSAATLDAFIQAIPVAERDGATLDFALVENSAGWLGRGGKEVRIVETPAINKNDVAVWHTNGGLELEVIRADIPPCSAINRDVVARLKQ